MSDGTSGGSFFDGIADKADGFVEESRGNGPDAAAGEAEEEADVGGIGDRLRGAFSKADGDGDDDSGGSWEPYEGPQGGVGWENQETGEVSYSDEAPGETPEGVPSSASEIEEMIESGEMDDNALEGGGGAEDGGGGESADGAAGGTEPGDTVMHEGEESEVVDVNDDGNPVVEGDDGELEEVTDDGGGDGGGARGAVEAADDISDLRDQYDDDELLDALNEPEKREAAEESLMAGAGELGTGWLADAARMEGVEGADESMGAQALAEEVVEAAFENDEDGSSLNKYMYDTLGPYGPLGGDPGGLVDADKLPDGGETEKAGAGGEDGPEDEKAEAGGGDEDGSGAETDGAPLAAGKAFVEGSMPDPEDAEDAGDDPPHGGPDGDNGHPSEPRSG